MSEPQTFEEQVTFIVGHLTSAKLHIQAEEYDKAIASLNEAMEPFAENGMLKFKPEDMDLNDFNNKISSILGAISLAKAYIQSKEYDKASEYIGKAIELAREAIEWFLKKTQTDA